MHVLLLCLCVACGAVLATAPLWPFSIVMVLGCSQAHVYITRWPAPCPPEWLYRHLCACTGMWMPQWQLGSFQGR